jgi:hypothetical protein
MIEFNKTYRIGDYEYTLPEYIGYVVGYDGISFVDLNEDEWIQKDQCRNGQNNKKIIEKNIPTQYIAFTDWNFSRSEKYQSFWSYTSSPGRIIICSFELDLEEKYQWHIFNNVGGSIGLVLFPENQINEAIIRDIIE